jgi:hypothetical protein
MTNEHEYLNHSDAGFEREDLIPHSVYVFLVTLAVSTVVIAAGLWGVFGVIERFAKSHQGPTVSPLVSPVADTRAVLPRDIEQFPQPRLETNERLEIHDFRSQEEQALASYGWVDKDAGVARIPIERAMDLIAERGLPTTPRAGTIPSSIVATVNAAAQAADRGAAAAKPEAPAKARTP